MKKLFCWVLAALGVLMLVAGLGARYFVYDRMAVMPADAKIDAVAETAPDAPATFFDMANSRQVTAALVNRTEVRGDVAAAKYLSRDIDQDVVVWDSHTCTGPAPGNCLDDGQSLSTAQEATAFSSHGSRVVKWSGAYLEADGRRDEEPKTTGYVFKLPFNVGKHDYTWYDADLGRSVALTYEGDSKVQGLGTYHFVEEVPATEVGTMDLPGALVGSGEPTVQGTIMYSKHLAMDVEPETGVPITTDAHPQKWVEVNGQKVVTMIDGNFSLTEQTVDDSVDKYQSLALGLKVLRVWAPLLGLLIGLPCLLLGLGLIVRSRRRAGAASALG
jgi:hypothetical protein